MTEINILGSPESDRRAPIPDMTETELSVFLDESVLGGLMTPKEACDYYHDSPRVNHRQDEPEQYDLDFSRRYHGDDGDVFLA